MLQKKGGKCFWSSPLSPNINKDVLFYVKAIISQVRSTAQNRSKKEDVFIGLSICVVMGLAWVFGFLMMVSEEITYKTAMSWLFNLFNSTQVW